MRVISGAVIAACVLLLPGAAKAQMPMPPEIVQPDCSTALSDFDLSLCEAQSFQGIDQTLNQTYNQLYQKLSPDGKWQLRHDELAWIGQRDKACDLIQGVRVFVDFDCAISMTQARTLELNARLAPPAEPTVYNGRYSVLGTAKPWDWQPMGLNSAYQYGVHDGTGPTVLLLSRLGAHPGSSLIIKYVSGQATIGPGYPNTDANGASGTQWGDQGGNGSTGNPFPSQFMSPYPINPGELVGGLADSTGQLVEAPFAIGDGPLLKKIPPKATQLQLGINDDRLSDNGGDLIVSVSVAKGN